MLHIYVFPNLNMFHTPDHEGLIGGDLYPSGNSSSSPDFCIQINY